MRLTETQRQTIKSIIAEVVGAGAQVYLFGSRVDDSKRGGDVDLLVVSPLRIERRAKTIGNIYAALILALGEQKIDILLQDNRPLAPNAESVFINAQKNGVLL